MGGGVTDARPGVAGKWGVNKVVSYIEQNGNHDVCQAVVSVSFLHTPFSFLRPFYLAEWSGHGLIERMRVVSCCPIAFARPSLPLI